MATKRDMQNAMNEAMETLTNMSMGAIGEYGPTIKELDDHVEATGCPWEDNQDYHTAQKTWRILEEGMSNE